MQGRRQGSRKIAAGRARRYFHPLRPGHHNSQCYYSVEADFVHAAVRDMPLAQNYFKAAVRFVGVQVLVTLTAKKKGRKDTQLPRKMLFTSEGRQKNDIERM